MQDKLTKEEVMHVLDLARLDATDEEINAVNVQLIALVFALLSAFISIVITYNQKLDLENRDTMYNSKQLYRITLFNRILILVLSFVFLYVNYKLYEISKDEGEDLKAYILQIVASVLTIGAGIIALYVVYLSTNENIVDVENPII